MVIWLCLCSAPIWENLFATFFFFNKISDLPVSVVVERVVVVAAVVVISVGGVGPESMKISIPCQNLWIPKILG